MCISNTAQEVCCVPVSFYTASAKKQRAIGWCLEVRATLLYELFRLGVLPPDVDDPAFNTRILPYMRPLCHMGPFAEPGLFDDIVVPQFLNKVRHTARKWVVDNRVVLRQNTPDGPRYVWSADITATWFSSVDSVQMWLRTLGKRNTAHVDARFPPVLGSSVTPCDSHVSVSTPAPVPPSPCPTDLFPRSSREDVNDGRTRSSASTFSAVASTMLRNIVANPDPLRLPHTSPAMTPTTTPAQRGPRWHEIGSSAPLPLTPPPTSVPPSLTSSPSASQRSVSRRDLLTSPLMSPSVSLQNRSVVSGNTCNSTVVDQCNSTVVDDMGGSSIVSGRTCNSTVVAPTIVADDRLNSFRDVDQVLKLQLEARRRVLEADLAFKKLVLTGKV